MKNKSKDRDRDVFSDREMVRILELIEQNTE